MIAENPNPTCKDRLKRLWLVFLVLASVFLVATVLLSIFLGINSSPLTTQPVICIGGYKTPAQPNSDFEDYPDTSTNAGFIGSIEKLGLIPLVLTVPEKEDKAFVQRQLGVCDALIMQGGYDVDPSLYGEAKTELCGTTDLNLDKAQMYMYQAAKDKGIPILAMCRGMQLITAIEGGTLWQDLSLRDVPNPDNHKDKNVSEAEAHSVTFQEGSRLLDMFPEKTLMVNSIHHQGIKDVPPRFRVAALSPDGLVEAIESKDGWIVATQFHPEILYYEGAGFDALWDAFAEQAWNHYNKH